MYDFLLVTNSNLAVADLTKKANSATYDGAPLSKAHAPPPKKKPLPD